MTRKLKRIENYIPCEALENEEIFCNGIFYFNISRIIEHIRNGTITPEREDLEVEKWRQYNLDFIKETHLPLVDCSQPVILAEISPGRYNLIDGHHRMEKAHRDQIRFMSSFKIKMEQLIHYFIDKRGYLAFVDYWNSKLKE
jgi:hypothetical protein